MAIQARVTSTDALESFRSSLIVFITRARTSVDDATDEVRRMKSWLQNEQWVLLEREIRKRSKALDQAQHDLRNAEFTGNQESAVQLRRVAVQRAKQALDEAETKLQRVKKWCQNYDHVTEPIVKKLESFRGYVADDLPKAVAYLRNIQKALEAYSESGTPLPEGGIPSSEASGEAAEGSAPSGEAAPAPSTETPAP